MTDTSRWFKPVSCTQHESWSLTKELADAVHGIESPCLGWVQEHLNKDWTTIQSPQTKPGETRQAEVRDEAALLLHAILGERHRVPHSTRNTVLDQQQTTIRRHLHTRAFA